MDKEDLLRRGDRGLDPAVDLDQLGDLAEHRKVETIFWWPP